jgi:hypothetical protein
MKYVDMDATADASVRLEVVDGNEYVGFTAHLAIDKPIWARNEVPVYLGPAQVLKLIEELTAIAQKNEWTSES